MRPIKWGARSARYVLNEDDDLTGKIGDCGQCEGIWIMGMTTTTVVIMIMMGLTCVRFSLHSKIFSVHQQCETNEILYLKKYRIFLKKKGFEDLLPRQNID